MQEMERIDKILNHDLFIECVEKNRKAEENRQFCRHDMVHFLDVARIGMILKLREGIPVEDELVYAAGLLHDIGRYVQYADGTPHELASAAIAPKILADCGFDDKETGDILNAIRLHRTKEIAGEPSLAGILYRADKASRPCFACQAEKDCNWKNERKNLRIRF